MFDHIRRMRHIRDRGLFDHGSGCCNERAKMGAVGFKVQGSGFRVPGFKVPGFQGSRFKVQGPQVHEVVGVWIGGRWR
jgi:hypothetical protein